MLERYVVEQAETAVCRLASSLQEPVSAALLRRGVDPSTVAAASAAVAGVRMPLTVEEVVDHSFLERGYLVTPFPVGRFGDGTIGVYYSARDEVTCERELVFHLEAELAEKGSETFPHPRFYNLIDCRYSGATVDLRGQEKTYPELVSETKKGYPFCQALGLEAVEYGIEGFFTASARNDGGVCVPVFARAALFEPAIRYRVTLTITDAGMQFRRL